MRNGIGCLSQGEAFQEILLARQNEILGTSLKYNNIKIYASINAVAGVLNVNKATIAYHIKHNSVLNNIYKIELYGIDS